MKNFRGHLKEKLKDAKFRKLYEEEKKLAALGIKIDLEPPKIARSAG